MTTLSNLIRSRREQLGLSLQDVADAIGGSKQNVQCLESGKSSDMRLRTAARLAVCLNVPLTVFIAAALFNDGEAQVENHG